MKLMIALASGVALSAIASTAMAQEAPAVQQVPAPDAADASDDTSAVTKDVIVTGSRTIRDGRDAPTPLTVAPIAQLELTPSNIPDALNKLPQFAGSANSAGAGNGTGSGRSNLYTGNFMNLRSFGVIRTLILEDGHRVPSTAVNGQVDTNTLPQLLVKRVEVVTGGASAVYGSDAVTGVVNFVIDKDFTGLKLNIQDGISSRGDAPSWKAGIAGGADILGRGHIIASFEHYDSKGLEGVESRAAGAQVPVFAGAGTTANPYFLIQNARLSNVSNGGLATSGPFNGQQFVGTGTLAAFNKGTASGVTNVASGGDGAYYTGLTLVPQLKTDQAFARFDYDLTDNFAFYVQGSGSQAKSAVHNNNERPANYRIFSGNAFLPASARAQLTATNTASFQMGRLNNDLSADSVVDQRIRTIDVTAGFTGKLLGNFNWEVYYTHGEAEVLSINRNNINYPRFYAALDAVKDPSGNVVCRVTITNPGLYPGCQPINMFGTGNQSAAAKAYVYGDTSYTATNKLDDAAASISGEPFSTWAGPVRIALNAEYREQSLNQVTSADPLAVPVLTGIRVGTAPTAVWAYPTEPNRRGSNNVLEGGGEILLPLLDDSAIGKRASFNGAVRFTRYSNSGSVTTWKLGLNYQPINDLRFRGTISQDIRAPSLADLYSGTSQGFSSIVDPHTGVTGIVTTQTSGNPNLVPEVARTYTAGVVYQPSWLRRFSLSFDYFNIRIDNAISSISGINTAVLQECETSNGTSPVCAAIVRPLAFSDHTAANFPTLAITASLNAAEAYTHGFDIEASYHFDLAEIASSLPGSLSLRALYTYQPVLDTRAFPTSPLVESAGALGLSATRIAGFVDYTAGPFSLDLQLRYSGPQKRSDSATVIYVDSVMPANYYTDINLAYDIGVGGKGKAQLFFNVGNLFDQAPRVSPASSRTSTPGTGTPYVSGDDIIGRYFTSGVRFRF
ncbi:MAG: TonB-dependent receptor [Sphingomonas bacterium]|uniref:TonB-dependent receptor domain-containing protein n=1 Tax=Sphingomonas bacterium TaxID=1895847 RepID=UPI002623C987|nr:TonB-dependent receptor [Sphingomonas bacterium]MDB5706980.1 TonB-dependent receptor [Sphingomonas bacterium]